MFISADSDRMVNEHSGASDWFVHREKSVSLRISRGGLGRLFLETAGRGGRSVAHTSPIRS